MLSEVLWLWVLWAVLRGCFTDLFTHMIWVYFCTPKFWAYKNRIFKKQKTHKNISRHILWFVCFPVQNMPSCGFFGGICVSLATSYVGFCIALCVVLVLNFQAVQSQACVSAALTSVHIFWKLCRIYFQIIFTENKVQKKWKYSSFWKSTTIFFQVYSCAFDIWFQHEN